MAEFSLAGKRVWVAGETGLVGRALIRAFRNLDVTILSAPHAALDLTDQQATRQWLSANRPDAIIMAAGRVGGIGANSTYPADFIGDNLIMAQNVIDSAHRADVRNLLYLGSSCIYPKFAPQPVSEDALLTGPLEETNEAYAIAKIAGVKLCQFYKRQYGRRYISAMPTNLYGPFDRFTADTSHVIPAMMLKFHNAADTVTLWGTGSPLREFLHVEDLATALVMVLERYDGDAPINIGSGEEISIKNLALLMRDITGFTGKIEFDSSLPDGTPRKLLDSSRMRALGWSPRISLRQGLSDTYAWFCDTIETRKSA